MKMKSYHLLLVEDEKLVAFAEADIIRRGGYDVTIAQSGEEAVELVRVRPDFSLILMDIDLGSGMDGTEAARRILELRDIPILFLSAHAETKIVNKTREITRYGYVLKDSGESILFASIDMALDLHESQVKLKQGLETKTIIADAAAAFVATDSLEDIYAYIGTVVKDISGASYMFISAFDEIFKSVKVTNVFGFEGIVDKVLSLFGTDPRDYSIPLSDMTGEELAMFTSKHLVRFEGGIHALSGRAIPQAICEAVESFLGVTSIYTMGFSWEGNLYGGITLLFTGDRNPERTDLIEILINLTAVAVRRIHAEEMLKAHERDFDSVVERSPDIIARLDGNLRYMYVSPAVERYTGIRTESFLGKTNREMGMPSDMCDAWEKGLKETFGRKQEHTIDFSFSAPGGEHNFHATLIPEFDRNHQVQFVLVISRDITDHSRAMHLLEDTLKENEILYKELEHRVRSSLAMISDFLSRDIERITDPASKGFFLAAQGQISSLIGFYDKIVFRDDTEQVNISAFFDELFGSLVAAYGREDSPIKITVSYEAIFLEKSRAAVLAVVMNELVTNALRYAFADSGKGSISVRIERVKDTCVLTVADDGCGISPETIKSESTLGLSLIKLFAERLSGRFIIESGKGTCATFSFPL